MRDKIEEIYRNFMQVVVAFTPSDITVRAAIEYGFKKGVEHGKEEEEVREETKEIKTKGHARSQGCNRR